MKKLKIFLTYISSNRVWIITLACLDVFFIFLAWLANPDYFINYVALIIFVSFATLAIPLAISIRKRNKTDAIFRRFLLEPDDTNEYLLCEAVPAVLRPYICELGQHLRTQQEYHVVYDDHLPADPRRKSLRKDIPFHRWSSHYRRSDLPWPYRGW